MRLFHVSEEADIDVFKPRNPVRDDLDKSVGLVWAIDEDRLPNFLTPRNCPRVTYHIGPKTTEKDINTYFTSKGVKHCVIIEQRWFEIMKNTTLYLYEFDIKDFALQDDIAGYYISKVEQTPINIFVVSDLFQALFERNVELRIVDNLWSIFDEMQKTTLNWSMCRMGNAKARL